jgi:hypothetical protein
MIADATLERVLAPRTVALLGDLIRASLWGAVVMAWAVFAQVYARMYRLTLADPTHSDFTIFYFTARLLADGLPMYGASPARYGVHWAADHLGNLNPPHFQLLVQPLAWLFYGRAYAVWVGVNAFALGVSVIVIVRAMAIALTWRRAAIGGAIIMSSAPFTTVAITSEWTFLLMLPVTLAWAAARREHWIRAGLWLGVCASLKLFFLLFIPWLILRRRWTSLAAMGAAAVAAVCVGVMAYGPFTYRQWLQSLGQVGWWWLPMNASWHGIVSRVFQGGSSVEPLFHLPAAVAPLGTAGALVFSAVTIWVARQLSATPAHCDLAFLLITSGALIASPLGWVYYMPLLLGPVIAVACTDLWRLLSTRELAGIGTAGAGLYVSLEQASSGQPSALLSITLASIYFWSAFAVWLGAIALSKRLTA